MINYLSSKNKKTFSKWYVLLVLISVWFTYNQYQKLSKDLTAIQIENIISDYNMYLKTKSIKDILIKDENYINNDKLIDEFTKSTPLYIDKEEKTNDRYITTIKFYKIGDNYPKEIKDKIILLNSTDYIYNLGEDFIELFGQVENKGFVHITKNAKKIYSAKETINNFFTLIAIIGFINILVFFYLLSLFNENERNKIELYNEQVKLNSELEKKIIEKTNEYKKQQELIQKQELDILAKTKNAQMGEMLGNIAHQWRQPLSVISTSATGMLMQKELNMLNDEQIIKYCNSINDNAQFLSKTIDTFTNYLKEQKEFKRVNLQNRIQSVIDLQISSITNNHIKLINNINMIEPIEITMVTGELDQVVVNLINNARDIILEKNIENGWIKINLTKDNHNAIIEVEDNAGGVPKDIIHKIFDPYFTTKHKSKGTGLGLYMSKKIIEKSLQGSLSVSNSKNGAVFKIKIPLS